jgi:hypothetical protein
MARGGKAEDGWRAGRFGAVHPAAARFSSLEIDTTLGCASIGPRSAGSDA